METEGILERRHEWRGELTDAPADTLRRYRADLLRLSFGVATQTAIRGGKKYLKWIDALHVGGDGHHGNDASVQSGCGRIGAIIADDDRGTSLARLRAPHGLEINLSNFASEH